MTQEIGDSTLLDSWAANGSLSEPDSSKIDLGWQNGERPAFQHMNWLQNLFCGKLNHVLQNGIPQWNATTTYVAGNVVNYSGSIYLAVAGSTNDAPPSASWLVINVKNNTAATDPTVNDDASAGYSYFSRWVNTASGESFICTDPTTGAAVWEKTTLTADELGSAAFSDTTEFATAAQGALADTALQAGDLDIGTQAEIEAETADKIIDGENAKYHPGVAKAWINMDGTGTISIRGHHNVSSIVDNGTGNYTVNLSVTMASANYAVVVGGASIANNPNSGQGHSRGSLNYATTSFGLFSGFITTSNSNFDHELISAAVFGDLA